MNEQWFCYDGCSFELFATEEAAARHATRSVDEWCDEAGGEGLNELADQVCYGRVTHVVEFLPSGSEKISGFRFKSVGNSNDQSSQDSGNEAADQRDPAE